MVVRNSERGGRGLQSPVCCIDLPDSLSPGSPQGPRISLSLPSFSGLTADSPGLLQYACDMMTNVRICRPARLSFALPDEDASAQQPKKLGDAEATPENLQAVLSGRPLITICFDNFVMSVGEPLPLQLASAKRAAPAPQLATVTAAAGAPGPVTARK